MFDAVIAHKARMEMVIDGLGKQPREDLVTSSLFGSLRFLTPSGQETAIEALVGIKIAGPVEIYLWPFLRGDGENSEPDVVIRCAAGSYWIVEVKWGAGLGEDQAGREIRTVRDGECRRGGLPDGPRAVTGYTLIGALERHAQEMERVRSEFAHSLTIVDFRWTDVTERLRNLVRNAAHDPGLVAWAKLTATFLDGQPEGMVLGEWPSLLMPDTCTFAFDSDERFALDHRIAPVAECQFNFREAP